MNRIAVRGLDRAQAAKLVKKDLAHLVSLLVLVVVVHTNQDPVAIEKGKVVKVPFSAAGGPLCSVRAVVGATPIPMIVTTVSTPTNSRLLR